MTTCKAKAAPTTRKRMWRRFDDKITATPRMSAMPANPIPMRSICAPSYHTRHPGRDPGSMPQCFILLAVWLLTVWKSRHGYRTKSGITLRLPQATLKSKPLRPAWQRHRRGGSSRAWRLGLIRQMFAHDLSAQTPDHNQILDPRAAAK